MTVPLFNVVASMGHGATMDWEEETVQEVRFKALAQAQHRSLVLPDPGRHNRQGDSMSPTFCRRLHPAGGHVTHPNQD